MKKNTSKTSSKKADKAKTIKLHRDEDNDNYYFDLNEVLSDTNINPKDVGFYKLFTNEQETGEIKLVLYDNNKRQIRVRYKKRPTYTVEDI